MEKTYFIMKMLNLKSYPQNKTIYNYENDKRNN